MKEPPTYEAGTKPGACVGESAFISSFSPLLPISICLSGTIVGFVRVGKTRVPDRSEASLVVMGGSAEPDPVVKDGIEAGLAGLRPSGPAAARASILGATKWSGLREIDAKFDDWDTGSATPVTGGDPARVLSGCTTTSSMRFGRLIGFDEEG